MNPSALHQAAPADRHSPCIMLGFVFRNRVRLRAIYGCGSSAQAQAQPPPVERRGKTVVLRPKRRRRA